MTKKKGKKLVGTPQLAGEPVRAKGKRWRSEMNAGIAEATKKMEHGVKKMHHETGVFVGVINKFAEEIEGGGTRMKQAIKSYSNDMKAKEKEFGEYSRAFVG